MKQFIGRDITKNVPFMDGEIGIRKLSVTQVKQVQAFSKELEAKEDSLSMLSFIIKMGTPSAAEMTEAEFEGFPLDELTKLTNAIMEYSGIGASGN